MYNLTCMNTLTYCIIIYIYVHILKKKRTHMYIQIPAVRKVIPLHLIFTGQDPIPGGDRRNQCLRGGSEMNSQ